MNSISISNISIVALLLNILLGCVSENITKASIHVPQASTQSAPHRLTAPLLSKKLSDVSKSKLSKGCWVDEGLGK